MGLNKQLFLFKRKTEHAVNNKGTLHDFKIINTTSQKCNVSIYDSSNQTFEKVRGNNNSLLLDCSLYDVHLLLQIVKTLFFHVEIKCHKIYLVLPTVMPRYGHPRWHKKRVITIKR